MRTSMRSINRSRYLRVASRIPLHRDNYETSLMNRARALASVFLFRALRGVISPTIARDIKRFASSLPLSLCLSIEGRRSRNTVVGGRDGTRYRPRVVRTTCAARAEISRARARTPRRVHFDILGPGAPRREEVPSRGTAEEEGPGARDLSFYYIASGRGEADAQLFMLVSRPIGRIGHIRTHLPLYTRRVRAAWW